MKPSRVLLTAQANEVLAVDASNNSQLILVARHPVAGRLRYQPQLLCEYLKEYCRHNDNNCPSGGFDNDCTHFVCHALNKAGVYVKAPSATCESGLCTLVNELAASFAHSIGAYPNVSQVESHAATREGDFCFIPEWFGIRKSHVMVLAGVADLNGAPAFGHTTSRCGERVPFEGADCVYYRIEE